MTEDERKNHVYLGDGVYAESTPIHIILRTGSHYDNQCDNKIYLEQDILLGLIGWLTEIKRIGDKSIIRNVDLKGFFDRLGKKCDEIMIQQLQGDDEPCHPAKLHGEVNEVLVKCTTCGFPYWGERVEDKNV